jgi:hypothetical protein
MNKKLLTILMISSGLFAFGQNNKISTAKSTAAVAAKQQQMLSRTVQGGLHVMTPPGACDTLNFPIPGTWTLTNYTAGTGGADGFVNGPSIYDDLEKAMFFDASATAFTSVAGTWILFDHAYTATPSKIVTIRVYDGTGTTPGATLGSKAITMGDIMANAGFVTDIVFPTTVTLPASKRFFVSVDISNLSWAAGDSLSIVSNVDLETNPGATWDRFDDGSWVAQYNPGNWDLNISTVILPYLATSAKTPLSFTQNMTSVCQGGTINFDATNSMPYSLLGWSFGTGNTPAFASTIGTTPTITGTFNTTGTYPIWLHTISGGCDIEDSSSVNITVNAAPIVTAFTTSNSVCSGGSVTLTGGGATTYTWTGGATNGVPFTPASSATYTVTGTTAGCTGTANVTVNVNTTPTVNANSTATGTVCPGTMVTLTGGGATTYTWTGGVTDATPFAASTTTSYTVTGTTAGCSNTANVTVNVYTVATPTVSLAGNDLTSTTATSYQWLLNGSPIGGATNQMHTATVSGNYSVEVTDANGCTATSSVQAVNVIGLKSATSTASIKVYPNPSKGEFNVSIALDKNNAYTIEVKNVLGQTVFAENVNNATEFKKAFDMSEKAGLYFVVVKDNAGKSSVHKVIVE